MTIKQYLQNHKIVKSYIGLGNLPLDAFFEKFGVMTSEEMIEFLRDMNNSYEIGKFIYYAKNSSKYYAYNGMSKHIDSGGKSTLGSSHSKYSG